MGLDPHPLSAKEQGSTDLNNINDYNVGSSFLQKFCISSQGSTLAWSNKMFAYGNGGKGAERAFPLSRAAVVLTVLFSSLSGTCCSGGKIKTQKACIKIHNRM